MAQRSRIDAARSTFPRVRTFGTAAVSGGQQFSWLWSRESLLRLILSFVLASALWLYISNKQNPSIAQDYGQPLQVTASSPPPGTAVESNNLGYVYVRFKRTDPNTVVTSGNFHPFVDLLGLGPGTHRVPVQVPADPGIQVVQVRPATIMVTLLKVEVRHVAVEANAIGKLPQGYGYRLNIQPSTVSVSGPDTLVPQVAKVVFDLPLSGRRASVSTTYPVRPENSQGSVVTGPLHLDPAVVRVGVIVQPFASYTTVPVLPQVAGQPKTGIGVVSLVSSPAAITLSGSPETLARIPPIKPVVSVSHRGNGTVKRRVRLQLPRGTSSPTKYVTVTVRLAPVESSTSVEIAVTPTGVITPGLRVSTISPAQLFTTIVGPSTALRSAATHVQATVNVTNLGVGTYTLTPVLTSHAGLHVESFYPPSVTVTLLPNGPG